MDDFRKWCVEQFERRAALYRAALSEVQAIAETYTGAIGDTAINIYQEALREVIVPPMSKYPGEVSEADKAWYTTVRKPDFADMLNAACRQIAKLKNT